MDVVGKNLSKRTRVLGKKKVETMKADVPPEKNL
jgi:hypothetical protein